MATAEAPLASVGAPAAAPSTGGTESSSAASSSTESTQSASVSTGAETSSEPIRPEQGEGSAAFLQRVIAEKNKAAAAEPAKPAEPKPAEKPAEVKPAVEQPKKGEEPKPATENKTGDEKPEATVEEDPFELEPRAPLEPSKLAATLRENPELAKQLDALGIKDSVFANARLAQKAARYEQHFSSPDDAAAAAEMSSNFGRLSEMFVGATDKESTRNLLKEFQKFSYVLDDDGNAVVDPTSRLPLTDGSVARFMDNVVDLYFDYKEAEAKRTGDENLLAAVETFRESTRGTSPAERDDLTEEQRVEAERLKTEKEEWARTQQADADRKHNEFETKVATSIEDEVGKMVNQLVDHTDLTDFNRQYVIDQIKEGIYDKLRVNPRFYAQRDKLAARPMSEKTMQARVGLAARYAKDVRNAVAAEVFKKANIRLKDQAAAAKSAADTRSQASRSDIKTGAQPPAPVKPPTIQELHQEIIRDYKAKNSGRDPSTAQMFQLVAEKKKRLGMR